MKKNLMFLIFILFLTLVTGCASITEENVYNEHDIRDFKGMSSAIKFEIVNFNNVLDSKVIKEAQLNGNSFLFIGGISGTYKEKEKIENYYYGYVKNKYGAMYFAEIPVEKVRVYEDSEKDTAYLIGSGYHNIDTNRENKWEDYEFFNLHVPKGTIIQKANVEILTRVQ